MDKNKITMGITVISLIINFIFSIFVIWVDNFVVGVWYIIWALAQLWLFILIMSNINAMVKRNKQRRYKSHKDISTNIHMK